MKKLSLFLKGSLVAIVTIGALNLGYVAAENIY